MYRVFKNTSQTFWNIFTSVKSFCVKFYKFVGKSYSHIPTIFLAFILLFHQMALIFFTNTHRFHPSSFEYSSRKWKCSVPAFRKWRHFSSSRVLVSDNWKQSITVLFFTINILLIVLKLDKTYRWENCLTTTNCACRRFMRNDLVRTPSFPVTLKKGGSWVLLRKCAVESTTLAQPFCVNQAVGDLLQHLDAQCVVVRQFSHR